MNSEINNRIREGRDSRRGTIAGALPTNVTHQEMDMTSCNVTPSSKFWLRVMNELKNRGMGDILIAVVDGLKGFPEAINAVFPQTVVQTCIVHLIRHSLEFVSWKDRKPVVPALRAIYRAKDAEAGTKALEDFEAGYWGQRYPAITQSWRRNWSQVVPFFAYPERVRRIIYTTNAIEALKFEAAPRRSNPGTLPH